MSDSRPRYRTPFILLHEKKDAAVLAHNPDIGARCWYVFLLANVAIGHARMSRHIFVQ
jgi:hypothetical protein